MRDLRTQYETAKKKANKLMQKGQLNAYLRALTEMRLYKNMMLAVVVN